MNRFLSIGAVVCGLVACGTIENRNSLGNTELYEAAVSGDLERARRLVDEGAGVDSWNGYEDDVPSFVGFFLRERASKGLRPLHAAAERQHATLVEFLIASGAKIDVRDARGRTPLWFAAAALSEPDPKVAEVLVEHGADVDATDEDGVTPVIQAASNGRGALIRFLAESGADLNRRTAKGETALHLASVAGHAGAVAALAAGGADVEAKTPGGQPALQLAVVEGHAPVVEVLLRAGADPGAHAPGTSPLLVNAAYRGQTDIVRLLLEHGATVTETVDGWTALQHAAQNEEPEIVFLLVHCGADPEAVDPETGRTPLQTAALNGHVETVRDLLDAGADPDASVSSASPPLARAAREGRLEIVRLLVEYGADVNRPDGGWTALRLAELGHHEEVVSYLREHGGQIE